MVKNYKKKFEIDIDLPKPRNQDNMQTYTEKIYFRKNEFKRIQISGPCLSNWQMIILEKN